MRWTFINYRIKDIPSSQRRCMRRVFFLIALVSLALIDYMTFSYYGGSLFSIGRYSLSTFIILGISAWFAVLILRNYRVNIIIATGMALVFFECVTTVVNGAYSFGQLPFRLIEMICWLGVFYLSYSYTKKLDAAVINNIMNLAFIFAIIFYIYFWIIYLDPTINVWGLYNAVYYPLFFFPFIISLKNGKLRTTGFLAIFAIIIVSYKRTAIILFVVAAIYYLLAKVGKKRGGIQKIGIIAGSILIVFLAVLLFRQLEEQYQLDWFGRILEARESKGSNRFIIWENMFNAMKEQSVLEWLVGHGYRTTDVFGGAHNDLLEILYDYGLIGFGLYVGLVACLIKYQRIMKKNNYEYLIPYTVSLIFFGIYSLAGQLFIMPQWFLILCIFWGITIAGLEKKLDVNRGSIK